MPRAEVGTPKYLANKMKSKGLQRLRWYCQVCEKQCRDENGFKCHAASESHLRQMLVVGEHAGKHIANFSAEFQSTFVKLLSRRFGTNRVRANTVYQEYIADKEHLHMNSTRWVTLTEFVKHLGRSGVARVDETEKGLYIAWIDNSPKALAKAVRQTHLLLCGANLNKHLSRSISVPAEGLKRDETSEKVVLSFAPKPVALSTESSSGGGLKLNPLKPSINPLKANPLKRPNPLKAVAPAANGTSHNDKKRPAAAMTAAERLIVEEQERKR
ncbi:domain of Kin17 curved DNA-binding protein-domain-containing [Salix suchowensis]|nr:domain of Kin17 curved DNA-binding protein-domain-containing [Salix suchowensis]